MGVPLKQMMDRFEAIEKIAHAKIAEDPTGTENSAELTGVPGSEKDIKVPVEAKKPDEEVAEGQPAGAASTEGAVNGGDAKPCNEGKLEFDETLLNPDKKPMETADALTAKTASLIQDLLNDIGSVKSAAECGGGCAPAAASAPKKDDKKVDKKDEKKQNVAKDTTKSAGNKDGKIVFDNDMISKLAAAVSVYNKGKNAAEKIAAAKQDAEDERRGMRDAIEYFGGAEKVAAAIDAADERRGMVDCLKAVKQACVKIAQDAGLPPEVADAVSDQAMEQGLSEDIGGAAEAGGAGEAEQIAESLPDDVTEEELGEAIVDLIQSGELPPEAAKEIVDAIASGDGADAGATAEDDVASIIADGVASGKITPEDAEAIAAELTGEAGADAGAAEAAAETAAEEDADAMNAAQGAADAEAAVKAASAEINKSPKMRLLNKVAGVLMQKRQAQQKYEEGFRKRAEQLGADPQKLARYILAKKAEAEKAKKQSK